MPSGPERDEREGNMWSELAFYPTSIADVGVRWLELMSKNTSKRAVGRLVGVSETAEVHVKVGPDGSLSVPASPWRKPASMPVKRWSWFPNAGGVSAPCWVYTTGASTSTSRTSVPSGPRWAPIVVRT